MPLEMLALVARFFLATVFLMAGLSKLGDRGAFEHAVGNYRLLPDSQARHVARWLPRLEVGCGLLLFIGLLTRVVALVAAGLLFVFVIAVSANLVRGRKIDCGCTGGRYRAITWGHVAKNSLLALAALVVFSRAGAVLALDSFLEENGAQRLSNPDALAVLITASMASFACLMWAEVRNLRSAAQFLEPQSEQRRRI